EITELHDLGNLWIACGQMFQGIVNRQQCVVAIGRDAKLCVEINSLSPAAVADPLLVPRPLDEKLPHGLGGCAKEVATAIPAWRWIPAYEPKIGFVHQGCGLQGLTRLLARQPLSGQSPQLFVNERQELLGSGWIARLNPRQDLSNVAQGRAPPRTR